MEPLTIGIIGCVGLLVLIALGVPISFGLLLAGSAGLAVALGWGKMLSVMTTLPFYIAGQYSYTPLPLFIFMANLIFIAGFGTSLYDAGAKWLSRLPGGLGIATVAVSTVFGTLTGSALVTAALFTKVSVPEMRKHGYDSSFAHGLTCASGAIGMLIPPSMMAIIYGILAEESIAKLFMAGVGPGLVTALAFSLLIFGMVKRKPKLAPLAEETFSWREKLFSLRGLWAILAVAVGMLVGIFTGLFTVTEGGAVGAFATFIIVVATRKMSWQMMKWACLDTAKTTIMVFLLIIGATFFSRFMTITGVTSQFAGLITESGLPPWGIMAGLMVMYLILGLFLDPPSILCITLPLVLPLVSIYEWNSIYFAILVLYNIHIAGLTPPVGLVLYAAKGAAGPDVPITDIIRGSMPFIIMMVFILVILVVCPPLAIGIARWMK